jgi:hypothetical protein
LSKDTQLVYGEARIKTQAKRWAWQCALVAPATWELRITGAYEFQTNPDNTVRFHHKKKQADLFI